MRSAHNVFIIAEAGVNHNGCLKTALQMIQVGSDAGADAVKFQTAVPEQVMTKYAAKAEYQLESTDAGESQLEMVKKIHLPLDAYIKLRKECDKRAIEFMSTGFDEVSLETLKTLDLKRVKIPSGEITNLPYLRYVGRMGKPVVMSTGMATLHEVRSAMNVLLEAGMKKDELTILHCNTEYPTPMEDVNMNAMLTIRDELGVAVGYSDHTMGIEIPIVAVALGATVIEKHFTLDRNLPGPDHCASLEPDELKAMITAIRNIERAMGDGVKQPSSSEAKNKPVARKSIVASRAIKVGELFSAKNLTVKRPGTGVSPMQWDEVIGRPAHRKFSEDDLIDL